MVRAKFKCEWVEAYTGGDHPVANVRLGAVYSDDPNHENKQYWDATPSGQIQMTIKNQVAVAEFEVGKEYYVSFELAE